jgi:nitrate reductase assembly molybdenum cofactor insertion protein NarJ
LSALASPAVHRQELTGAFAELLSYPHDSPLPAARRCAGIAREASCEAGALVEAFASLAEGAELGELQEAYTRTFDLDTLLRAEPTCHPYVGHYLFEESHKRGAFILGLRKRFRAQGFEDASDLADHLVVLLRFLAVCRDETVSDELVDDAILPALRRVAVLTGERPAEGTLRGAYLGLLRALVASLAAGRPERAPDPVRLEVEREWTRDRDSLGIDRAGCN